MSWVQRNALRIKPLSVQALSLTVVLVILGAVARQLFFQFGATLTFATFFPTVLIASLFAGAPAGILSIILSITAVWWMIMPPAFRFDPLTRTDYANFMVFVCAAGLIVWLSVLYRTALESLSKAEDAKTLLINELNHRSGNMLALIQSIVKGSLGPDKEKSVIITERIRALARANRIAAGEIGELGLADILRTEIETFADLNRVTLSGPQLTLPGDTARHIALVVHELTTNAVKYGALSDSTGRIAVSWEVDKGKCRLHWNELGGPRLEATPERTGFGSRMMRASAAQIGAHFESTFSPEGLRCDLSFDLPPSSGTQAPSGSVKFSLS